MFWFFDDHLDCFAMPTYDYVCDICQHAWESFQSMSDKPLRSCPKCGKRKARRLIGAGAGLIFKGSGFYCTDYKKSGAGSKSSGESSGDDSSSSSDKQKTLASETASDKKTDGEKSVSKPTDAGKPAETSKTPENSKPTETNR